IAVSLHDGSALAGGYDHGKATGSCSISPSPAAVGQPYTVSVSGLSLNTPDYLTIIPPNKAGYTGAFQQQVFPDANGNWSGSSVAEVQGEQPGGLQSREAAYLSPGLTAPTTSTAALATSVNSPAGETVSSCLS